MGQTSIFNRWTGYWDLSAVVSKCLIPPPRQCFATSTQTCLLLPTICYFLIVKCLILYFIIEISVS